MPVDKRFVLISRTSSNFAPVHELSTHGRDTRCGGYAPCAVTWREPFHTGAGHSVTGNGPLLNRPCRSRSDCPPPYQGFSLRQSGTSTTRPSRHKWTLHFLFTPEDKHPRFQLPRGHANLRGRDRWSLIMRPPRKCRCILRPPPILDGWAQGGDIPGKAENPRLLQ